MTSVHVVLAGGSCGNTLYLIEDQLKESFDEWGFDVHLITQNIWQRFDLPRAVDLVLQTLPAYKASEVKCEVLSVRPMIRDRQDPKTLGQIRSRLEEIVKKADEKSSSELEVGKVNA